MDDFEFLSKLRALGVKHCDFLIDDGKLRPSNVEFFETKSPGFGALDLDTLIPPAHDPLPDDEEAPVPKTPPALARLLKEGNVS